MEYKKDYYHILGVAFNATSDEIKESFREQAKKHHPDCGGKAEDFVDVHDAYEILSDESKRKQYDQWYIDTYISPKPKQEKPLKVFKMRIYSPVTDEIRDEVRSVDTDQYPANKYATDGTYYAIEKYEDQYIKSAVVLVLFTRTEWWRMIDRIREKRRIEVLKRKLIPWGVVAMIALIIGSSLFGSSGKTDTSTDVTTSELSTEEESSVYDKYKKFQQQTGDILANYIEMPRPSHGETMYNYKKSNDMSILEIKLPEENTETYYYIKLVNPITEEPVQAIFMDPATTAEIVVPCGYYKLKYACGQNWYGYDDVFGPYGGYNQSDEAFEFTAEYGHSITLYPVVNGNMETENIDFEDF